MSHICLFAVHYQDQIWSVNLHADSVPGHGAILKEDWKSGERKKSSASDMKKWGQIFKSY